VGGAYREIGAFPASPPQALGLQVQVPEGQRLRLRIESEEGGFSSSGRVFVDVYRSAPEELRGVELQENPRPALLRGEVMEGGNWSFDAEEMGRYVVRIQPEYGGLQRYDLSVQIGAPWRFPVAGAGEGDIGSFFGDSRDGGRRDHHGVDIFARRGTPVLAAADGLVRSVDTTEIGGRVVWQREADGRHSIYYAHLDEILVRDGQRLQAGDTVGLVGNTGNARTTPPHLHFGAYRRGPRDPWNLILPIPPETPRPVYRALRSDGSWTVRDEGSPAWLNAGGT
jgi:murein DD-endopeptidase MepM/ murein hydrolase activator NlpD